MHRHCYSKLTLKATRVGFFVAMSFLGPLTTHAITIDLVFRAQGEELTSYGTATSAPGNAQGNGELEQIMNAVVSYWESAYSDPFTLTVEYGWFPRDGGTTATHRLLEEGGDPHRETRAAIAFDSDQSTIWFKDPTPAYANEFDSFQLVTRDLGAGPMNTGRVFSGPQGDAVWRDLVSTAMHEVGHALGLSSANDAFVEERTNDFVDVMSPLSFAGSQIPLNLSSAHLDLPAAVMRSSRPSGVRRHATEADILANAQISQFTQVNLLPSFASTITFDFDGDGNVDVTDLNMLLAEGPIANGVTTDDLMNGLFDLNLDGVIDNSDRDEWLVGAAAENGLASPYLVGDSNLDGVVDGLDFINWNDNKFGESTDWDDGDFDGDGVVDGLDFIAWNENKFMASDTMVSNIPVPEPQRLVSAMLICLALLRRPSQRHSL